MMVRVLLIEDSRGDAALVVEMLRNVSGFEFDIDCAARLETGLLRLQEKQFDVVLLDVNLPDSRGLETVDRIIAARLDVPVILLTGVHDERMAEEAVKRGAQDYLVKGQIESRLLVRSIRYSIERKRIVIENEHLYRQAAEANEAKDRFLATLSHELRTPLTAILGWVVLLQQQQVDADNFRRAVDSIERNARLQVRMIDELLDLSRIINGKLDLKLSPTNLVAVINAAVDAVRFAAQAKSIAIETQLDRSVPAISGDPDRLQQVIWNLLSNSVKFTPPHGRVDVRLMQTGDCLDIKVQDTGVGISQQFLPYVFERFRQADGSSTRAHGGLGLGLAIVKHLVQMHGGSITAESQGAGAGATFTVRLPIKFYRQSEAA